MAQGVVKHTNVQKSSVKTTRLSRHPLCLCFIVLTYVGTVVKEGSSSGIPSLLNRVWHDSLTLQSKLLYNMDHRTLLNVLLQEGLEGGSCRSSVLTSRAIVRW